MALIASRFRQLNGTVGFCRRSSGRGVRPKPLSSSLRRGTAAAAVQRRQPRPGPTRRRPPRGPTLAAVAAVLRAAAAAGSAGSGCRLRSSRTCKLGSIRRDIAAGRILSCAIKGAFDCRTADAHRDPKRSTLRVKTSSSVNPTVVLVRRNGPRSPPPPPRTPLASRWSRARPAPERPRRCW